MLTAPDDTRPSLARTRRSAVTRALAAAALLALAGCSGGANVATLPPPLPAPAPAPEPTPAPTASAADVEAIAGYWQERSAAFAAGPESGLAFLVARLHPRLATTVDECRQAWFSGSAPPAFREAATLEEGTVVPDPEWTMPYGPLRDLAPGEGVHRMIVDLDYSGAPPWFVDRRTEVHLQVDGDTVRNFLLCQTYPVVVGTSDGGAATGATALSLGTAPAPAAPAPVPSAAPAASATTTAATAAPSFEPLPPLQPLPPLSPMPPAPGPSAPAQPAPTPTPSEAVGTRPAGTGLDFCPRPDGGPQVGDYTVCPDAGTPSSAASPSSGTLGTATS